MTMLKWFVSICSYTHLCTMIGSRTVSCFGEGFAHVCKSKWKSQSSAPFIKYILTVPPVCLYSRYLINFGYIKQQASPLLHTPCNIIPSKCLSELWLPFQSVILHRILLCDVIFTLSTLIYVRPDGSYHPQQLFPVLQGLYLFFSSFAFSLSPITVLLTPLGKPSVV